MKYFKFDEYVRDWINTWNSHDLDRIMFLYAKNYNMTSPRLMTVAGFQKGTLKGKDEAEIYWRKLLNHNPNLHFKLVDAFVGVSDYVIEYMDNDGNHFSEIFGFNQAGKISRSASNYAIELLSSENREPRVTLNDPNVYFTAQRAKPVFDEIEFSKIEPLDIGVLMREFHTQPLPDCFSRNGVIRRLAEVCLKEGLDVPTLLDQVINDDPLDDHFSDIFEKYGMEYLLLP